MEFGEMSSGLSASHNLKLLNRKSILKRKWNYLTLPANYTAHWFCLFHRSWYSQHLGQPSPPLSPVPSGGQLRDSPPPTCQHCNSCSGYSVSPSLLLPRPHHCDMAPSWCSPVGQLTTPSRKLVGKSMTLQHYYDNYPFLFIYVILETRMCS